MIRPIPLFVSWAGRGLVLLAAVLGFAVLGFAFAALHAIPGVPAGRSVRAHTIAVPSAVGLRTTIGDVRLDGVRAPGACYNRQAAAELARLAWDADLTVAPGAGRADVWAGKTSLGRHLVAGGWLRAAGPKYAGQERDARRYRRGLWGACPR